MIQTVIPQDELEVFRNLKNIRVVFDVGARTDTDYLEIRPKAVYHLFEPAPDFFKELKEKIGSKKNVYLNNYGLSDVEENLRYSSGLQAFESGEANKEGGDMLLPLKTLDWYVKEYNIKRIDFLKIDTEGYDYKILKGGLETIKITKYIQYEHWDNLQQFHDLLGEEFEVEYIGYRNVLCISRKLVNFGECEKLKTFLHAGNYKELR